MTQDAARRPPKGLDTTWPLTFIGYEQAERMIAALLERAGRWRPEAVAGIARAGLVQQLKAARALCSHSPRPRSHGATG